VQHTEGRTNHRQIPSSFKGSHDYPSVCSVTAGATKVEVSQERCDAAKTVYSRKEPPNKFPLRKVRFAGAYNIRDGWHDGRFKGRDRG
jgi:hypothetical protein